jgi:hypothetical protein
MSQALKRFPLIHPSPENSSMAFDFENQDVLCFSGDTQVCSIAYDDEINELHVEGVPTHEAIERVSVNFAGFLDNC